MSTGGAEFGSGTTIKNMVTGATALAAYANEVAKNYPVNIALHTDHCPKDKLDGFVRPLIALSTERVKAGGLPIFQSHMWDGSAVPLAENLKIAEELLALAKAANIILEVEIGVVGGEEDGVAAEINEQLYTTPEDALATVDALGLGEKGRYMAALTFGNVHGVYKPGNVKLRPEILKQCQDAVVAKYGDATGGKPLDLVFHGGSGSLPEEIADAVDYGVVKMNVDTDTQYAFTRPVAGLDAAQLRRRAQGRRRGGQQEAVRPARVGQGGRGFDGRPGRGGVPGPALRRHPRGVSENLLGMPETRLPADPAADRLAGLGDRTRPLGSGGGGRGLPGVLAGLGVARGGCVGPRRGGHGIRVCPGGLPPWPGRAAAGRLATVTGRTCNPSRSTSAIASRRPSGPAWRLVTTCSSTKLPADNRATVALTAACRTCSWLGSRSSRAMSAEVSITIRAVRPRRTSRP